jgi:hypothetical protein
MDNIKLTRDSNTHRMTIDTDLRSSDYNNKLNINKMDITSNKDINIGLDLLTNPEKSNKKNMENDDNMVNSNNMRNNRNFDRESRNADIELDHLLENDTKDSYDNLVREMGGHNISAADLDQFSEKRTSPNLIDENEINNMVDRQSNQRMSQGGDAFSRNNDVRSNRDYNDGYRRDDYRDDYRRDEPVKPIIDFEAERKEKEEILFNLEKYRRLGVQNVPRFNMSSDIEDMRMSYNNIKHQRELEQSIKFQRNLLITFSNGLEMLNGRFDYFGFKLDGWSEKMKEDITDYNEVFEELHEKYKDKAKMSPELKLLGMVGGSAFMFHLTNSMFKNSAPGIEEIMKQNPDLMRQFANAAINQMPQQQRPAANFFNNLNSQQQAPPPPQPRYNPPQQPSYQQPPQPQTYSPRLSSINNDPMNSLPMESRNIKKIPEPVGVDDILKELESNTNDNYSDTVSMSNRSRSMNIERRRNMQNKNRRTIDLNLGD